jgi:hypothetical protein
VVGMRHILLRDIVLPFVASVLLTTVTVSSVAAQAPTQMGREEIAALARVQVAIGLARDSAQAQLAKVGNKKPEVQQQLRDKLRADIAEILHHSGMTEEEFQRKTYLVSTDSDARKTFDSVLVAVTGQPTPGQYVAPPANPNAVKVPAGPVGTHIGHVVNAFGDTPNGQGLLPTALAEAKVAIQHAALAMRNPGNLDQLKLHAGHVINALDPTIVPTGPGAGYGVKKAAIGVATHIDLAAKAAGASQNVITHAMHIATSARNTVQRADSIVALAKLVQAATSATDAAAVMSQIVSLTEQLVAGADKNGDGRITWEEGEGGLQQAQEHVNLMLAAEKIP